MDLNNVPRITKLISQRENIQDQIKCLESNKVKRISFYDQTYRDDKGFIGTLHEGSTYVLQSESFIKRIVHDYLIQMQLKLASIEKELQSL